MDCSGPPFYFFSFFASLVYEFCVLWCTRLPHSRKYYKSHTLHPPSLCPVILHTTMHEGRRSACDYTVHVAHRAGGLAELAKQDTMCLSRGDRWRRRRGEAEMRRGTCGVWQSIHTHTNAYAHTHTHPDPALKSEIRWWIEYELIKTQLLFAVSHCTEPEDKSVPHMSDSGTNWLSVVSQP